MPKRSTKVKDKWREKTWITILTPKSFGNKPIASIPVTDVEHAMNRTVETTLFDLLQQDPAHYNIKLFFKIAEVEGETAYTIFKGHEYSREFIKSLVRRGSSMINFISDYRTRDGYVVRVYVSAFTQGRVNSSKKSSMRKAADSVLKEKAASLPYDQFIQEVVLGKLGADVFGEAKKVAALRHMDIRKTKLISMPEETRKKKEEIPATPA
ncbi:MAG: 30S ribosomal protein S3ae [Nitrososphaerota archaeon]|jgi:small subunit ribosomal protein S3Ae|nr:30S ribosomal protein S3ae [Nitrososphaerota archaeon]